MAVIDRTRTPAAPGPDADGGERVWMKRLPWVSGPLMLVVLLAIW
jgi:NitT/TauT family transport system permease protein